jgi:hypothetical protein
MVQMFSVLALHRLVGHRLQTLCDLPLSFSYCNRGVRFAFFALPLTLTYHLSRMLIDGESRAGGVASWR